MNTTTDFKLPLHSRVWIYQSSRFFTPQEVQRIQAVTDEFLETWNSHGKELSAEIHLLHDLFLIVAVDEAKATASGCSIDKSVRLIKDLEKVLDVSLTGRTTVAYFDEAKKIQLKNFAELKKEISTGTINDSTIIFNNLLSNLADLQTSWMLPANDSWLMDVRA